MATRAPADRQATAALGEEGKPWRQSLNRLGQHRHTVSKARSYLDHLAKARALPSGSF